jgi:hypothetical protein
VVLSLVATAIRVAIAVAAYAYALHDLRARPLDPAICRLRGALLPQPAHLSLHVSGEPQVPVPCAHKVDEYAPALNACAPPSRSQQMPFCVLE